MWISTNAILPSALPHEVWRCPQKCRPRRGPKRWQKLLVRRRTHVFLCPASCSVYRFRFVEEHEGLASTLGYPLRSCDHVAIGSGPSSPSRSACTPSPYPTIVAVDLLLLGVRASEYSCRHSRRARTPRICYTHFVFAKGCIRFIFANGLHACCERTWAWLENCGARHCPTSANCNPRVENSLDLLPIEVLSVVFR